MEDWENMLLQPERAMEECPQTTYVPLEKLEYNGEMEHKTYVHGPVLAHVLNFSTKDNYPYKFVYPVCTNAGQNGQMCTKSLEFGQQCDHHSLATGDFTYFYRFGVLLSDARYDNDGLPPLWCTFSQEASAFLEVPAMDFYLWKQQKQYDYVRNSILNIPLCEVYLTVEGKEVIVQILSSSFALLSRPLSPHLPNTSLEEEGQCKSQDHVDKNIILDKGKGKIAETFEEQFDVSDELTTYGNTAPHLALVEGETPDVVQEQEGKAGEIEEVEGDDSRDGSNVNKSNSGPHLSISPLDQAIRGGRLSGQPIGSVDDYMAMFVPHRAIRQSPSGQPLGSLDVYPEFEPQEPESACPSPKCMLTPAARLSEMVKNGWRFLMEMKWLH
jgi:hypothetical protein